MYQHTFSTLFHSLNTQPSDCCIHLPDIISIGDSLKFPPPPPSSPLLSQFPETSPLNKKKGWMRLGAGAVVLQRTTISYLSTASKATSESALLRLPPVLTARFGEISLQLDDWTIERSPNWHCSESISFPPSVDLILSAISSNLLLRKKGVHMQPYFLVLNEVRLPLVYFFKGVLVWGTVGFCFLVFVLLVLFGCQSKSAFSSKPRLETPELNHPSKFSLGNPNSVTLKP